jgi:hypothetical protein
MLELGLGLGVEETDDGLDTHCEVVPGKFGRGDEVGLISGDGASPRSEEDVPERVLRSVGEEGARVAGDDSTVPVAVPTTVLSPSSTALVFTIIDGNGPGEEGAKGEEDRPTSRDRTPRRRQFCVPVVTVFLAVALVGENSALLTGLSLRRGRVRSSSSSSSDDDANRRLDGVRARSGESRPSANKTRRFEGLSQPSGGAVPAKDEGAGLRARFLLGDACFDAAPGVTPSRPPSRNFSRASSSSGRREASWRSKRSIAGWSGNSSE